MTAPRLSPLPGGVRIPHAPPQVGLPWRHERAVLAYALIWLLLLYVGNHGFAAIMPFVTTTYFGFGLVASWTMFQVGRHQAWDARTRRAWVRLGYSATVIVVTGTVWTGYLQLNSGAVTPTWIYWLTAMYQPLAVYAFLSFPGDPRISLRDRRAAFDAALLTVGALGLSWYFSLRPTLRGEGTVTPLYDISTAIGTWVVVLSACVGFLRVSNRVTRTAISLMMLAQVLFVLADYVTSRPGVTYRPGDYADVIYFSAWALRWWGARVALRGAGDMRSSGGSDERAYHSGIAPAAFVAGAFGLLLVAVVSGDAQTFGDRIGIVAFVSIMTWQLVARQGLELKETERELRAIDAQKERFRSVVDSATDYIFVVDAEHRLTWASPSTRTAYVVTTRPPFITDFAHPDDVPSLLAWLPGEGRPLDDQPLRVRLYRGDGAMEHVELRGQDLRSDVSVAGIVINGRDRTAEVALEGRVRHAEKLATLHDMAGRIAHAFNNALAVVQGHGELLAADPTLDESWRSDVADIRSAAARGAAITKQLLGFSGRQVIQPEALDPASVIEEMLPTWHRLMPVGTTVRVEGTSGAARVVVDRAQFEQVFFNLVVNARDAMPRGGEIVLTVQSQRRVAGELVVTVAVSDDGIGMGTIQKERIFEPFFTTKAPGKGTGLGLAMVQTIVRRAGGDITVETAPAEGSTFTVTFPATEVRSPHADDSTRGDTSDPGPGESRGRVALVDDEDAVRNVTRRLLERAGFSVRAFGGGVDALAMLAEDASAVDVLVTDMMMPGMSGRELIGHVVASYPQLPVICITGFTADVDTRTPLPPQVQRILEKPFEAADIIAAVRRVVASRSTKRLA